MAKETKKMDGAANQADLNKANATANKANAMAALQTLANFALQLAQQQSQEVQNAASVLERVIHDATETWSSEPKIVKADDRD